MPATLGIVTTLNDPESGAVPGPDWLRDLATLSPAPNHLILRCSVSVDSTNRVDIPALRAALQAYKDGGFEVWLVLHMGLEVHYQSLKGKAYLAAMPNAVLGLDNGHGGKDMLLNDYIQRFSLTCVGTLEALGDLCPASLFVANECNLDGPALRMGMRPHKPQSLAPEVFGALLATTAKRIRAKCPQVTTIIPGSLTCLVKYNTSPSGPWIAGYLHKALDYVAKYGVVAPYDFSCLSLNLEGFLTQGYVAFCAHALSDVMRDRGIAGQTIIGEFGVNGDDATDENMAGPMAAAADHFSVAFLYCHDTLNPHSYGTTVKGINPQGQLYPVSHTPWFARYQNFIAGRRQAPAAT